MNVNLILMKKNGSTKSFPLPGSVTTIGRRQECDLCIPLMVVSRKHCELNQDQGRLMVRDLGSRNGTFVNGKRIDEAQVGPGDKVKVGAVTFAVQINGVPASDSAILRAPVHIGDSQIDKAVEKADEFSHLEDIDTIQGHNVDEIFDDLEGLDGINDLGELQDLEDFDKG